MQSLINAEGGGVNGNEWKKLNWNAKCSLKRNWMKSVFSPGKSLGHIAQDAGISNFRFIHFPKKNPNLWYLICSVTVYRCFGETCCINILSWRWKQNIPPNRR
jgi:hypothetical protein